jgi:hypothetical protein
MIRRFRYLVGLALAVASLPASADAAPIWLDPVPLSPAGSDVNENNFDVAMSAAGDVLAVWGRGGVVEASFRPAGGSFGPVETVPAIPGGSSATGPVAAFDGRTAVIAYSQFLNPGIVAAAATRNADGTYAETKQISAPGLYASVPRLASNAAGDVVAFWRESDGNSLAVMATRFRPAGGTFEPPATFASTADGDFAGAVDAAGDAIVVWDDGKTISSASRPAGGSFGPSAPVVTTADELSVPTVALRTDGTALVTYLRADPTTTGFTQRRPWATLRAAGASAFGTPEDISANDLGAYFTGAAIDGHGDEVAIYEAGTQPWAAVAPPGGAFGDAVRLSPAAMDMYAPQIEVSGDGATHVAWLGDGEDGYAERHVVRPAGGDFSAMNTVPGGAGPTNFSSLAVDGQGDAAALWRIKDADNTYRVVVAGYDAAPPQLRELAIPSAGPVATPLAFSVAPVDVWSPVASTTWDFGDGTGVDGAQPSHAFAAPGAFTARVTATDALGNAAGATGSVSVTAAAPPPPPPLALGPLSLSPRTFRAASHGPSLAKAAGTRMRFTIDRAATVRFGAQRRTTGRRVGRRCVKTTKRNRRRARCKRYASVKGSASRAATAGANSVRFSGRLAGRRLRPGRYRIVARATDTSGAHSAVRRAAFRIVR